MTDGATAKSVGALLAAGLSGRVALSAPERSALTGDQLRIAIGRLAATLSGHGVGPKDRVAIVLPNGPEMVIAFLAVASFCVAAPLNPNYREEEFEFYLGDLLPKVLLLPRGGAPAARAAAARLGVAMLEIEACEGEAIDLRVFADDRTLIPSVLSPPDAEPGAMALLLHTSGTTSRPKIVPLSQANLTASAGNIARTLRLGPDDVSLVLMPLFHIHGLIAAVLAPLAAGGSIYCPPPFNALKFAGWLEASHATWYTAVPTMHQTILDRMARRDNLLAQRQLRFIRSSSASLAPSVMERLEAVFRCPVIEAYGMTEAAHQMTSNPLPPRSRKPGSVGVAAGPEVAIMLANGELGQAGETGEVVIRGANVTTGYLGNSAANGDAFRDGWFRTGDLGALDTDGYLTISGRLKEIINRGGEKIAPREVDEVLMGHAAVEHAVTFAMPHDKLGEEVAAVVVLRSEGSATERELRDFAALRLADFKVPRHIYFRDTIPTGSTGKVQRIGLAQRLGLA